VLSGHNQLLANIYLSLWHRKSALVYCRNNASCLMLLLIHFIFNHFHNLKKNLIYFKHSICLLQLCLPWKLMFRKTCAQVKAKCCPPPPFLPKNSSREASKSIESFLLNLLVLTHSMIQSQQLPS